ncbi:MAG: polysaccharide export protein [Proteobacteria bacterium]|nr:polysaccharide export protein [Pseudomonadota bacterium]
MIRIDGWIFALAALLCLALAGCGGGPALVRGNPNLQVMNGGLPAPDTSKLFEPGDDYRIGAQDLLTVTVFGVPDLTQDVRVDALGRFTLSLIGTVDAGGRTPQELSREIAGKLRQGYLQDPQVTVFVKSYDSQQVTVGGIVKKPGVFPLTGPTTLLQVIAMGGGPDDLADHRGVVVFRTVKGQRMAAVFDIDAIAKGRTDDPQIYSHDVVMVALSKSKDRLRTFIQTAPSMGLFRLIYP